MTTDTAFHCDKRVRFQHCDPAGIVFYPQYFVLFHEVLEDWFNHGLGVDYARFIGTEKLGIPTVHIQAHFVAPSKHGETLRFALEVRETGRSSIKLGLTAAVDNELRAKIEQTVVLFSLERRAAVVLPAQLRQQMMQFAAQEVGPS
ncbi:acyl-CoA thioesterase [Caballeronia sp. EK]|uniref:acyl-CoA thioesterase n=1 Tax=Caballeronia sp. EK TaxID=2767469 RepID=UPI0016564159|nr:thioesterase family protein [Caballeronia sp. EK]MBC8642278.1 acyl-CoA thioesterase [Caballeronia sp. EK]